ncbi:hypothetical protein [Nonomuraea sediminis]|uniref:hypothetical protein n=1 Tax=Nonomuraea sediminis TaxID=2835864 RepID=UPI003557D334
MSAAATGNPEVKALVYLAAFVPETGERPGTDREVPRQHRGRLDPPTATAPPSPSPPAPARLSAPSPTWRSAWSWTPHTSASAQAP